MGHKLWISFIIVLNIELQFDQFLFLKGHYKMKKTGLCWGVSLIINDLNNFIAFICEMVQWKVWEIKDKSVDLRYWEQEHSCHSDFWRALTSHRVCSSSLCSIRQEIDRPEVWLMRDTILYFFTLAFEFKIISFSRSTCTHCQSFSTLNKATYTQMLTVLLWNWEVIYEQLKVYWQYKTLRELASRHVDAQTFYYSSSLILSGRVRCFHRI